MSALTLLITATLFFFSCQKDITTDYYSPGTPADLSTKINSSVYGFVIDETNAPIANATVQFGAFTTNTDKYGYFEAKNVQVVQNAAFVAVSKPGYFKGIKTYTAKAGKAAFFRIKMLPKEIAGGFSSASGGTVTLFDGSTVAFPANAVVNASTNAPYSGAVKVAAFHRKPTDADIDMTMPGNLRGINTDGALQLLKSYGVMAVELTGASGELLQLASGKKATLSLTLPATVLSSAPATVPLWYLDEANGLWKQEGTATKTASGYMGDVSHFSFWQNGMPGPFVQFDATVVDATGSPIPFAQVTINWVNGINYQSWGYTDMNGYISGDVSANEQLLLNVTTGVGCTASPFSFNFTTTSSNISLGNLTLSAANSAQISGSVINCSNAPVTNGYFFIKENFRYYRYPLSATGTFNFSLPICSSPQPVLVLAQDMGTSQYSTPLAYNLTSGTNNIPVIKACGNSPQEFMYYTLNGTSYSLVSPGAQVYNYIWTGAPATADEQVFAESLSVPYTQAEADFTQPGIGPNSVQQLTSFKAQGDSMHPATPIPVYITEFGNIGEHISGSFSGTIVSAFNPAVTYTVSCSFRTKRYY